MFVLLLLLFLSLSLPLGFVVFVVLIFFGDTICCLISFIVPSLDVLNNEKREELFIPKRVRTRTTTTAQRRTKRRERNERTERRSHENSHFRYVY